jgi:phage shock protein E
MNIWKLLFGGGNKINFAELLQNGAQIIDVRTKAEYEGGHIAGSQNIPLQVLETQLSKIQKDRPVITCCASGMRSGSAKSLLEAQGYEVYNGGGWASLGKKLA